MNDHARDHEGEIDWFLIAFGLVFLLSLIFGVGGVMYFRARQQTAMVMMQAERAARDVEQAQRDAALLQSQPAGVTADSADTEAKSAP